MRAAYAAEQQEIKPRVKLVIETNHKPQLQTPDQAIEDRLIIVPFLARFTEDPKPGEFLRDHTWVNQLKSVYLSEIFTYMAVGAFEWYHDPIFRPTTPMLDLKRMYLEEQRDTIGCFLRDCVIMDNASVTTPLQMYQAYRNWVKNRNLLLVLDLEKLQKQLKSRMITVKSKGFRCKIFGEGPAPAPTLLVLLLLLRFQLRFRLRHHLRLLI